MNFSQPNVYASTSDAIAMYLNINNDEGIAACEKYFKLYAKECKQFFPSKLIIRLLRLIMTKNDVKFGNTFWLQEDGTAMGTPCACNYVTIAFAHYERTCILPRFKDNLLLYVIYIDDILLIWKDYLHSPIAFNHFKLSLDE